jgi:hypothetical protein
MSVNKFLPHVFVIPEDRADEQIANGFVLHDQVDTRQIQVLQCADGWGDVLEKFEIEYIPYLKNHRDGYVILLIDFDLQYDGRRERFDKAVPGDLKNRVFVVGAKETPETLRQALGMRFEDIGLSLAEDCYQGTVDLWNHDLLSQNEPDRIRLLETVRSIVFPNCL